ncbi:MAG: nucleotidyltransferase domain-containing protein [bacterium]
MNTIDANLLQEAVQRLVQEFAPERIILFGSHAWGTPNAGSDVDLLVIVPFADLPPTRRATRAYRCLRGLKIPTEIIVSTKDEIARYQSVHSSLSRKILSEGKVIYG